MGDAAMTETIERLKAGFRAFRSIHYEARPEIYQELADGQHPEVLLIACSDSRVDPAILLNAQPGELFVVRNVANLVPPYEPDGRHHSTSAAIEFAVRDLKVRHVVILGHSRCGGIKALREGVEGRDFIGPWTSLAAEACRGTHNLAEAEQAAIAASLANLAAFPWVRERMDTGELFAHGWWFDLEEGRLLEVGRDGSVSQAA